MTEQVKTAIKQMRQAGFTREQFFVRVERIYRAAYAREGCRNPYDYGFAQVMVRRDANALIEAKKEALLAAGLGVDKMIYKSGYTVWLIRIEYSLMGKFREMYVGI